MKLTCWKGDPTNGCHWRRDIVFPFPPFVGLCLRSVDVAAVEERFGLRRGSLAELLG